MTSMKRKREKDLSPSLQACAPEERWCEHTKRRQPSASKEVGSHQEPNWLAPRSWTSHPPNCEKVNFPCSSQPVSGILVWLPNQTKTIRNPMTSLPFLIGLMTMNEKNEQSLFSNHSVIESASKNELQHNTWHVWI